MTLPINRHQRIQPPNFTSGTQADSGMAFPPMSDFWDQPSALHSPLTPNGGSEKVVPISPAHDLPASSSQSQSQSQSHTPLTPPLTPASSLNDNLDSVSTGGSVSSSSNSSGPPYSPAASRVQWNTAQLQVHTHHTHAQVNAGSRSPAQISSSIESDHTMSSMDFAKELQHAGVLRDNAIVKEAEEASSRFLLVTGVPKDVSSEQLMNAFKDCGDIRGIFTRFREQDGTVVLAFYDCRQMPLAKHRLDSQSFFGNVKLSAQYIQSSVLQKLIGNSPFMIQAKGELYITVEGGTMPPASLQKVLLSFGELRAFEQVDSDDGSTKQAFIAEYSDSRDGQQAMRALDRRTMLGYRLRVVYRYRETSTPATTYMPLAPEDHLARLSISNRGDAPQTPALMSAGLPGFSNERHEEHQIDGEQVVDTTNSSPFTHRRPLPALHDSPHPASAALTLPLHHTTSEQDLRRLAATSTVALGEVNSTVPKDAALARRTSITFGLDALRHTQACANATASIKAGQNRPRSISESSASATPPAQPTATRQTTNAPNESSHFPSTPQTQSSLGLTLPHTPQSSSVSSAYLMQNHQMFLTPPGLNVRQAHADPSYMYYPPQMYWSSDSSPLSPMSALSTSSAMPMGGEFVSQSPHSQTMHFSSQNEFYAGPLSPPGLGANDASPTSSMYSPRSPHSPSTARRRGLMTSAGRAPSDDKGGNSLDIDRIEQGLDTRTTVMIKNVPNKLTDQELIDYIGKVIPRRIDFLYLRMDFQNGCNVGYAFVNFITVQDLLHFAKARLGVKWNMFSSEKRLQLNYATYQGKEALVEKFKNSCVMDERESWRPKIFHSSGPLQGMPEPFPTPTHLRRKERSSQNRGALYVPGPVSPSGPVLSPAFPTLITANGNGMTMPTNLNTPPVPNTLQIQVAGPQQHHMPSMIAGPGPYDENLNSPSHAHLPFRHSSHQYHYHQSPSASPFSPSHQRATRLEHR